jgi:hypothetical protein
MLCSCGFSGHGFHLLSAADLGMRVAAGTWTRFLVDERSSAFLAHVTISSASSHFTSNRLKLLLSTGTTNGKYVGALRA